MAGLAYLREWRGCGDRTRAKFILRDSVGSPCSNVRGGLRAGRRSIKLRRQETRALRKFDERVRLATQDAAEGAEVHQGGAWDGVRKFHIERKVQETDDVCSYYLKPYDGKDVPLFDPGQHLTFELKIPDQPKPIMRCYSLSEAPILKDQYRVTIRRQGAPGDCRDAPDGLASSYLHDVAQKGDTIDVRAPRAGWV